PWTGRTKRCYVIDGGPRADLLRKATMVWVVGRSGLLPSAKSLSASTIIFGLGCACASWKNTIRLKRAHRMAGFPGRGARRVALISRRIPLLSRWAMIRVCADRGRVTWEAGRSPTSEVAVAPLFPFGAPSAQLRSGPSFVRLTPPPHESPHQLGRQRPV